jgi:hypothetical protein
MGAAESQPDSDLVLRTEDVLDVRLEVGKGVFHQLEALPPDVMPVLGTGQFGQVDDEIRSREGQAPVGIAGVERLESGPHELDVRGGRGGLRGHSGFLSC